MKRFPDCVVYVHENGYEALYDERLNLSKYNESSFMFCYRNVVQVCGEKADMIFDGFKVEVIHTPGHHPGAVCYRIGDYLFSGDSYIPGIKTVANLPLSDKKEAMDSEILIKSCGREM